LDVNDLLSQLVNDVSNRTGSASLPAPAVRFGPIISPAHTNDLALARNGGLLWSVLFRTLLGQE
jgi:hypothetical protein